VITILQTNEVNIRRARLVRRWDTIVVFKLKPSNRRRKGSVVGGHHGECGARAYNEGLGAEPPAGVQGQSPWSGGRSPPEAESILVIGCPTEPANLAPVCENSMLCYGPLVSELGGGQSAWCPPTPSLGGLCPQAPTPMNQAHSAWPSRGGSPQRLLAMVSATIKRNSKFCVTLGAV